MRDLLVGDTPVAWLRNPAYLLNASFVAVTMFFVRRLHELPETFLLVADALRWPCLRSSERAREWTSTSPARWRCCWAW